MKILLFGANGQVGSECRIALNKPGWQLVSLTRQDADFSSTDSVYNSVKQCNPDIVVNACAYTAVDKAESESDLAYQVNATSVAAIGNACQELNIPTIHISTDYVFNGNSKTPYTEADPVAPTGVYGASKLAGEQQLREANPKSIVLRTSWVFGLQGNNFVKTMLRLGAQRDELGVVGDQYGCPTYAADIASVIEELVAQYQQAEQLPWGVYHYSNHGRCSWYDFALKIFECGVQEKLLPQAPKVNSITTDQYPTPAVRPASSVLNCTKLETLLGRSLPHWHQGLINVCRAL